MKLGVGAATVDPRPSTPGPARQGGNPRRPAPVAGKITLERVSDEWSALIASLPYRTSIGGGRQMAESHHAPTGRPASVFERLAGWSYRRRWRAFGVWVVVLAGVTLATQLSAATTAVTSRCPAPSRSGPWTGCRSVHPRRRAPRYGSWCRNATVWPVHGPVSGWRRFSPGYGPLPDGDSVASRTHTDRPCRRPATAPLTPAAAPTRLSGTRRPGIGGTRRMARRKRIEHTGQQQPWRACCVERRTGRRSARPGGPPTIWSSRRQVAANRSGSTTRRPRAGI